MTAGRDAPQSVGMETRGNRLAPEQSPFDAEEKMPPRLAVIEQIGERGLLLPERIAYGLAANDRARYYLTLLQTAAAHAQAAGQPFSNLRVQREASGVSDAALDHVIEASGSRGNSMICIPGVGAIIDRLFHELRRMLAALQLAGAAQPQMEERLAVYQHRLEDLQAIVPAALDDIVSERTISSFISTTRNGHDTLHQLIVDLHGELSRLQSAAPSELVHGATTYGLTDRDRGILRAFTAGVNETAPLKFDHPGLSTMAARDGAVLSIQSDLGAASPPLVVIHIEELAVTVTYADIHRARIRFFQTLLEPYHLTWMPDAPAPGGEYWMAIGKYAAEDRERLERCLRFVGSRLVFLIDWPRARKRLSRLVGTAEAVSLLKWAADHDIGHRAFVQIDGGRLIETAFERAVPTGTRFGARLADIVGAQAARSFLMSVLTNACVSLKAGQSRRLLEDKIEAELLRYLDAPDRHVLSGIAEHATMIAALVERVRRFLLQHRDRPLRDDEGAADIARTWTQRADDLLRRARASVDAADEGREFTQVLGDASAVAGVLEDTLFLMRLLPDAVEAGTLSLLDELGDTVSAAARSYVRCLQAGQDLSRSSDRTDVDGFLSIVDRLVDSGRDATRTRRAVTERLVRSAAASHDLFVVVGIAEGLERAAVLLARCASIVRDSVLRTRLAR